MPPSVFQGLKSSLEPRLVEPCILSHKLAPPNSNFSQSIRPNMLRQKENTKNSHNENIDYCFATEPKCNKGDLGAWSFIQALADKSNDFKDLNDPEKVYVHPLVKHSASTLTTKSLEMCTESLGSETGSDISESMEELPSMSRERENFHGIKQLNSKEFSKKLNHSGSFPPPLTSISGSDGVQVRPHREGGRLVIKATTVTSCNSKFQAERINGRLRLSLLKENSSNSVNGVAKNKETESTEEDDQEFIKNDSAESEIVEKYHYEEDNSGGDGDDGGSGAYKGEDTEGNGGNVGDVQRPSRCKEGGSRNEGMSAWEPLWVATS